MQRVPARVTGERLEEQPPPREPIEDVRRVVDPDGLEQGAGETLEVDGPREGVPDRLGRLRDHLLREVGEQRALRSLQALEHRLAPARRRGAQRFDGQADRRRPAVGGGEDPGGSDRGRLPWDGVGWEQGGHQRVDLGHGERQRDAPDVRDLALRAQPLDAERRVVAGRQEDVQRGWREPDQRLDEPPRTGGPVDLVAVVEHQQQVLVEDVLQRVGDERGGRLAALLGLSVVAWVGCRGDGRREVLREVGQLTTERCDHARGERAERGVRRIDRVPGRRPAARRARGERALPEPRAGDDDGQPAIGAGCQRGLESGAVQRAVGVARRDQLGRATDPARPGPGGAVALRSPFVQLPLRWREHAS